MLYEKMNKGLRGVVIGSLITLTACGTLDRGTSKEPIYKAVDVDLKHLGDLPFWYKSLLIGPIVVGISLPIDAGMDTLLYPYDKWQYNKKMAPEWDYNAQVDTVSMVGVNLTEGLNFRYSVSNQKQGFKNTTVNDYVFKLNELNNITNLQQMDIYKKKTSDHNLIFQWTVKHIVKQSTHQGGYDEEKYTNVTRYVTPPEVTVDKKLLIALFMPCNQVVLLPSESMTLTQAQVTQLIKQSPEILDRYSQLYK